MSEAYNKVHSYMSENNLWDNIYVNTGEDNDGEHYTIFDDWEDHNSFVEIAKKVLELDEESKDYDVEKLLETNFVFSDEYTTCTDCDAVIRTSPDSYHWQPDFYVGDGFIACNACFNDTQDYQEEYLKEKINNPKNAINGLISESQLEELGFEKLNDDSYENGWHRGQDDDPTEIYNKLSNRYQEIVFLIDDVSQFYLRFSVWVRGEENEEE